MGLGDIVSKAVYLGIGLASYAGEKAGEKMSELRVQVQKLADDMVERGEMTADEARKFVDDMVSKAQQPTADPSNPSHPSEPRRIEILDDTESPAPNPADAMRQQVAALQEELERLRQRRS